MSVESFRESYLEQLKTVDQETIRIWLRRRGWGQRDHKRDHKSNTEVWVHPETQTWVLIPLEKLEDYAWFVEDLIERVARVHRLTAKQVVEPLLNLDKDHLNIRVNQQDVRRSYGLAEQSAHYKAVLGLLEAASIARDDTPEGYVDRVQLIAHPDLLTMFISIPSEPGCRQTTQTIIDLLMNIRNIGSSVQSGDEIYRFDQIGNQKSTLKFLEAVNALFELSDDSIPETIVEIETEWALATAASPPATYRVSSDLQPVFSEAIEYSVQQ